MLTLAAVAAGRSSPARTARSSLPLQPPPPPPPQPPPQQQQPLPPPACHNYTGYIGVRRRPWGTAFVPEIRDGNKRR